MDPVVHVCDTVFASRMRVRCSLICSGEALEQVAPLAEEHRDDMEVELVADAGGECELRGSGAVDQHVLVAPSLLGLGHRGADVVYVGDQAATAADRLGRSG
jgi:hypothetical protein